MAYIWFFSHKWFKFCLTCLKFCIETAFGIAHERKKRVDQVPKYFACKRQKFKKSKIKILQKSSKRAISRKIFKKFPHATGNKSPNAYLLVYKIWWHFYNRETQKYP